VIRSQYHAKIVTLRLLQKTSQTLANNRVLKVILYTRTIKSQRFSIRILIQGTNLGINRKKPL
jgi:hypothetical protein